MKKTLIKIVAVALSFAPVMALAQQVVTRPAMPGGSVQIENAGQLAEKIGFVVRFFGSLIFAIAVLVFLYAGFMYLTAGENEENATKARQLLTYGVIGLVIALVSWSLPALIASIFGGTVLN